VPDKRDKENSYYMPQSPARVLTVAAALYALTLCAGSFLHHDFGCQLSSRTHCTSCVLNASTSATTAAAPLHATVLSITGRIDRPCIPRPDSVDLVKSTGRSPPSV